ncbi:MAG TPA: hypothetical protein VEX15_16190 [Nocardioidaceae bacterium]|nr:hypothetical protein [Nocardioidaceae bacterium]
MLKSSATSIQPTYQPVSSATSVLLLPAWPICSESPPSVRYTSPFLVV